MSSISTTFMTDENNEIYHEFIMLVNGSAGIVVCASDLIATVKRGDMYILCHQCSRLTLLLLSGYNKFYFTYKRHKESPKWKIGEGQTA